MSKIPGDSPSSGAHFPPRTPYVFTGRTIRVESEAELKNVPKNAVRLTRREVITAADRFKLRKEFKAYRDLEERFPVYSGVACIVTSCYLVSIIRHKFRLGRYHARGIHYVTASVFPSLFVPIACVPLVQESALIKETPCADCLGIRSGAVQFLGGVVWASSLAVLGALYYAKRYHTVPLPPFSPRYWREYGQIIAKPFKPAMPYIFGHSLLQFVVGYVAGIKFWYRGQEMNAVDNYMALKSMELSGAPAPVFVPVKVETDWFTETIATGGNLLGVFGRAIAKDDKNEEQEEEETVFSMVSYYIRRWSKTFFGGSSSSD